MKMTDKQKVFCKEYLKQPDATLAAIKAGYSKNSARTIGSENLKKPVIREYIQQYRSEVLEYIDLYMEDILERFKSIAIRMDNTRAERMAVRSAYQAFCNVKSLIPGIRSQSIDSGEFFTRVKINVVKNQEDRFNTGRVTIRVTKPMDEKPIPKNELN